MLFVGADVLVLWLWNQRRRLRLRSAENAAGAAPSA